MNKEIEEIANILNINFCVGYEDNRGCVTYEGSINNCISCKKAHLENCKDYAEKLYNAGYRKQVWHKVEDGLPNVKNDKRTYPNDYRLVEIAYKLNDNNIVVGTAVYFYFSEEWDNIQLDVIGCIDINPLNIIAWADLSKYEED